MNIAIASDHGGYDLKMDLSAWLREQGHQVEDFGCPDKSSCDYADFAEPAARAVAEGRCERGIVICTTGIGVSITANKVDGIRCALCGDVLSAELTRRHNDANMLALGAGVTGVMTAERIVDAFLNTGFEGGRHARRVGLMMDVEKE